MKTLTDKLPAQNAPYAFKHVYQGEPKSAVAHTTRQITNDGSIFAYDVNAKAPNAYRGGPMASEFAWFALVRRRREPRVSTSPSSRRLAVMSSKVTFQQLRSNDYWLRSQTSEDWGLPECRLGRPAWKADQSGTTWFFLVRANAGPSCGLWANNSF